MKKKVFLTLTLTIPLIVACSSYGPTPKLYTQFEKASLKTRVAEKYEWQLKEIGNEFSYVFDFDHSQTEGKPDHFLRVFYTPNPPWYMWMESWQEATAISPLHRSMTYRRC